MEREGTFSVNEKFFVQKKKKKEFNHKKNASVEATSPVHLYKTKTRCLVNVSHN